MAEKHFYEQRKFAENYLIPHLEKHIPDLMKKNILEVGCAEAGVLDYLQQMGVQSSGVELVEQRVRTAQKINPSLDILVADITDRNLLKQFSEKFDLVIMRDVIEHIVQRHEALQIIHELLVPEGFLFITFPPRFSPFAGHQQHARSFLRYIPYVHFLPETLWRRVGRLFKEKDQFLEAVMNNYRIGLSINSFEQIFIQSGYRAVVRDVFWLRPIFKFRYGTPILKFPNIPFLREFKTTGCEYLLQKSR